VDDRLAGQVWVTVVATGLGGPGRRRTVREPSGSFEDTLDTPSFLRDTPA
jgi:hypothetical protein